MGGYLSLAIKAAGDKEPDKNLSSLPVSVTSSLNNTFFPKIWLLPITFLSTNMLYTSFNQTATHQKQINKQFKSYTTKTTGVLLPISYKQE